MFAKYRQHGEWFSDECLPQVLDEFTCQIYSKVTDPDQLQEYTRILARMALLFRTCNTYNKLT